MSAITKRDVIDAAMSVAEDVAESRLDPAALDQAVAAECRELFGTVVGEGDSLLWPLHIDVCRQALALGALTADELSEWLAVARSRTGEPPSAPEPPSDVSAGTSSASGPLRSEIAPSEAELTDDEAEADQLAAEDQPEQAAPTADADAECACGDTTSAMVDLPDGRRIPRRHIIARGRGLPVDNGLREL